MLQVKPSIGSLSDNAPERWALMQKTPPSGRPGSVGSVGGDWFTSPVDMRINSEGMRAYENKLGRFLEGIR